jgi:Na+/melibiose symporter-like transporter
MGAAFTIPDAILADIVDYDELHTGLRNEGLYSVVENNLQQYVEIIGGVVPGIVAGLSGFVSNGGCSCGCGTACPQPYLRWSCEAPVSGLPDIGYACSSDFTAEVLNGDVDPYLLCLPTYLLCLPPTYYVPCSLCTTMPKVLYGDVDRTAPCTMQTDGVQWTFRLFFAFVPGVCYLLAAVPASLMTISKVSKLSTCVSKEVTRYHAPRLARFTFLLTGV